MKNAFVFSIVILLNAIALHAATIVDCKQKAEAEKQPVYTACFAMAKEAASKGDEAALYSHLQQATKAGYANVGMLKSDPAFARYQNKKEFQDLIQLAQKNLTPCAFSEEFRAFDFWIGEWTVTQAGQFTGDSSIQLILDKCVIFENYTGKGGYSGKSFNLFNPVTRKWYQLYVDNSAMVLQLEGQFKDGALEFHGETPQADGSKVLESLVFRQLEGGRISQVWRQSSDGGKTWNQVFDGVYTRKK
jgi:hypothetical protein